jgi:hypothetical protein
MSKASTPRNPQEDHMKGRKGRATGGDATVGTKEYEQDLAHKNQRYTYQSKVNDAAEERKRGGKVKKHVGKAEGAAGVQHAGRKPRKSGGRAGSNMNPLSSAHAGTQAKGRGTVAID